MRRRSQAHRVGSGPWRRRIHACARASRAERRRRERARHRAVRAPGRLRARAGRPAPAPRKRDSSRGARRWPATAASTACTSSGSTPAWPCISAHACAARSSAMTGARRQAGLEVRGLARVARDRLHVVEQRLRGVHARHLRLAACSSCCGGRAPGSSVASRSRRSRPSSSCALERRLRIAELDRASGSGRAATRAAGRCRPGTCGFCVAIDEERLAAADRSGRRR